MFELTFNFYLKHEDVGFFPWLKKQNFSTVSDQLPKGVTFLEIAQPVVGEIGKIQAKFLLSELSLISEIYQASLKSSFLKELHTFMDNARPVDTTLSKKLFYQKI